jgi:hypothetical protein
MRSNFDFMVEPPISQPRRNQRDRDGLSPIPFRVYFFADAAGGFVAA